MNDPMNNNISLKAHVRPVEPKGKLLGFASVVVGDSIVIDNFRVLNGKNGMYVGMPSFLDKDKKPRDVCRPITKDFYAQLQSAVADAYRARLEKAQPVGEAKRDAPGIMDRLAAGKERSAAYSAAAKSAPAPMRSADAAL